MALTTIPDVTPLTEAACPLLTKFGGAESTRLLDRFNQAVEEVRKLQADRLIGPLLATEKFAAVLAELAKVRSVMTRNKYVVGFIGLTQAGKSTMVNNVLNEEVTKEGSGDAMSSLPCRIVKDEKRSLEIEYLTPTIVSQRRQKLCEAIGLPTDPGDRDLLPMLNEPEQFAKKYLKDGKAEPPRLRDDLKYFNEFLKVVGRNSPSLAYPPVRRGNLSYDRRYEYTTHPSNADALILREARFLIDNPNLPVDLEMCDLPGLDSKRTIDDVVTWEYLPSLDGTFLFVNTAANLLTEGMLDVFSRIKLAFNGTVGGRVWVIFNKMDSLTGAHFRPGGDNIFAPINGVLKKLDIPASQACFGSKKVWDEAKQAGGAADPMVAAKMMSQPAGAPVPAVCPQELQTAWKELLKDGGVSEIRRLMCQVVAVTLAGEIRAEVDRRLDAFTADLTARVQIERKRSKMDQSELQAAMTCYYAVLDLRVSLITHLDRWQDLNDGADRLRRALARLFDNGPSPEVLAHLDSAELARQYDAHARVLDQTLHAELAGELLDRVYDEVGKRLAGLPVVPVGPDQQGCLEAWRRMALQDRATDDWLAGRPVFANGELETCLAHPKDDGFAGETYIGLMREKIDAVVRQSAHLLRSRLRHRLGELTTELAQLTGKPEPDA